MEVYLNTKKIIGVESFWAVFNTQTRRPENLALPHEHFEKFAHTRGTALPFAKIDIPTTTEFVKTKKVQWSDLDIVNHVNNVKYLEWCLDADSKELQQSKSIRVLEMNFLSELNLEDEVEIHLLKTQNEHSFSITKAEKVCYLAQIEWK
jgi:acyl-ACP thioesterase